MAVTTTSLGFQKPDGNEAVRDGDNIIAANAQKSEDRHQEDRGRLTAIEAKNIAQDADIANARTGATADSKTYTDGAVAADRVRLDTLETTSTTQDGRIGANELGIAAVETKKVDDSDSRLSRKVQYGDYATPFADVNGYVSGGVQNDGVWNYEKSPRVKGQADVTMRPLNTTGWAIPFADKDGYVAGGIRPDGTAEFAKLTLSQASIIALANQASGYTRSSRYRVAAIGDSLTDGFFGGVGNQDADSYPAKLQALMPAGVTVFNLGNTGYTVDEEAVRVGALPVPLTVSGGSIPASGPVNVTTTAVIGWRPSGTTRTILGTLAGVPGTLTRTTSDTAFTFTRTTSGTAVTATGSPVFVPDFAGHDGDTAIILLGRNNVSFSVQGPDASIAEHVAKGIDRIVNWLSPSIKHVLVVSNTTTTAETSGSAGYLTVTDINARLAAAYPTRYLDLRAYLVNQAIYDLGITPTTADNTAMAADTLPPSIMDGGTDNTHWSKATAALVAAQINNYLTTRGWV
jgi:flagellar basal body rod protein FlgC